jgi:hypothetical protein
MRENYDRLGGRSRATRVADTRVAVVRASATPSPKVMATDRWPNPSRTINRSFRRFVGVHCPTFPEAQRAAEIGGSRAPPKGNGYDTQSLPSFTNSSKSSRALSESFNASIAPGLVKGAYVAISTT